MNSQWHVRDSGHLRPYRAFFIIWTLCCPTKEMIISKNHKTSSKFFVNTFLKLNIGHYTFVIK